jgi:hypothetical protein
MLFSIADEILENHKPKILQKGLKICNYYKKEFQPNSNSQKNCCRDENPECQNDRYFSNLWEKGRHLIQLPLKNPRK